MKENLIQGSNEWLEVRKKCITSTDAAIINGTNTFNGNSPYKLWQKKLGLIEEELPNDAMLQGSKLESSVRKWFNAANDVEMEPMVVFNDKYEWIMASLDGYSEKLDYIIEIKCGLRTYEKAENSEIPPYYYDQIQHALFASNKFFCNYISYRIEKDPIVMLIERNNSYIEKLIKKEKEFYNCLITNTPPAAGENDFIYIDSDDANQAAEEWKKSKEQLEEAKKYEEICRSILLDQTDDGNCIFPSSSIKIERVNKKGNVDIPKLCLEFKIDQATLDEFRKESIGYPKITIIDQKHI